MKRILVVEDDTNLGTSLASMLEISGYEVAYISDGNKTIQEFERYKPDAIVLDVMLNATLDGFELAQQIRLTSEVPILFTTSLNANEDLRKGFSIPMSDYVHKPYKVMEICLRLKSLLERSSLSAFSTNKDGRYQLGIYSINFDEYSICQTEQTVSISHLESKLLRLLVKNQNKYISKALITQALWKCENPLSKSDSINTLCSSLRKHLAADNTIEIENKKGIGVRLIVHE